MALPANPYVRKIFAKHKFLCEVPARIASGAFNKCSELKKSTAKIEYHEGGAIIPIKDGGRVTYSDATLARGTSKSQEFHDWCNKVNDATIAVGGSSTGFGRGQISPEFKDDVGIVQLDRDNSRPKEHHLVEAFPIDYVAGDWDNGVDEVVIETLTLTYDWFLSRIAA